MPPAESILDETMREVHPGAGSVRQMLSRARKQPLSVQRCRSVFCVGLTNRVEPRISPPLSLEAVFFMCSEDTRYTKACEGIPEDMKNDLIIKYI
ncbi:MAG: hypothetical protein K0R46_1691 [Herbinix sp.]|jgi:hypothetical protein|nr:hypothetical protein [Herbinix sp.]